MVDRTGLADYALIRSRPKIIFCYHRILPKSKAVNNMLQDAMWVSPSNFESQIQWMTQIGKVKAIEDLVCNDSIPLKPTFAITFDDGWLDNYEYAFPILKKYNIPAKIFLSTNAIETNEMFWTEEIFYKTNRLIKHGQSKNIINYLRAFNEIPIAKNSKQIKRSLSHFIERLKLLDIESRRNIIIDFYEKIQAGQDKVFGEILSWQHIREMRKHNITFGSHTHNHMITKGAEQSRIIDELIVSKKIIEQRIDVECKWFCYPNAMFNNDDHLLLSKAGYDYGVIMHSEFIKPKVSPYYLPRFIMYQDITDVLGYIKLRLLRVPFF